MEGWLYYWAPPADIHWPMVPQYSSPAGLDKMDGSNQNVLILLVISNLRQMINVLFAYIQ